MKEEKGMREATASATDGVSTPAAGDVPSLPMRWYVVHTYSGHENKVRENIQKMINTSSIKHHFGQIVVPTEEVAEMKKGKKTITTRKFFPSYILIEMNMSDEAFHHKFGKIWADRTIPKLSEEEHEHVEQWAANAFQVLLFNLVNAEQKQEIYTEFGLDWRWVRSAILESFTDEDRRRDMTQNTNIFRVLIKTLLKAGIITERTRPIYAMWVDMDELARESDEVVGSDVAEEGIAALRDINKDRKKIGRALKAAI